MHEPEVTQPRRGALLGQRVGGLVFERLLGAGGMGEVYVARHETLGVERAVKVIHDDQRADARAAARFQREAAALARLQHPNIVQVIDFGALPDGQPYLVMELVNGRDLSAWLETNGPMALPDALQVLAALARALEFVHAQGVVHRDLKPANVLIDPLLPGQPKLLDFGLAHMLSEQATTRLTAEHQLLGSPAYMAPEQADGSREITHAADVYAFAGIAYALLSGQPVFPGLPLLGLVFAHCQQEPEALSKRVELPLLLDRLMLAALAKQPAERPRADELAVHLERLLGEHAGASQAVGLAATVAAPREALAPVAATREGPAAASTKDSGSGGPALRDDGRSVALSDSLVAELGAAALVELLVEHEHGVDPSGIRDATVTQALAVVRELAEALAPARAEVASVKHALDQLDARGHELELDLAVADAERADAVGAHRATLEQRCDQLCTQVRELQQRLDETHRALLFAVVEARAQREVTSDALFRELDELVSRLTS